MAGKCVRVIFSGSWAIVGIILARHKFFIVHSFRDRIPLARG
jgi:hypothetical protein